MYDLRSSICLYVRGTRTISEIPPSCLSSCSVPVFAECLPCLPHRTVKMLVDHIRYETTGARHEAAVFSMIFAVRKPHAALLTLDRRFR